MTPERIIEVLQGYQRDLGALYGGIQPVRDYEAKSPLGRTQHLLWMAGQAIEFVRTGHIGKANRWLGSIQGCCWWGDIESVEAAKRRFMPPGATFDPDNGIKPPPIGTRFQADDAPAGSALAHIGIFSGFQGIGQFGCMEKPHVEDLQHAEQEDPGCYFQVIDQSTCPICRE